MLRLLIVISMLFIYSCNRDSNTTWDSTILNLDSLSIDFLNRKVALSNYLDSTESLEFLKSDFCIYPIVDTSTEYYNEILLLNKEEQNDMGELLNRDNIHKVDLKTLYTSRRNWCNLLDITESSGVLQLYNASRSGNFAMVTISIELLSKAGKLYLLLLEKNQFGKWILKRQIDLAVY